LAIAPEDAMSCGDGEVVLKEPSRSRGPRLRSRRPEEEFQDTCALDSFSPSMRSARESVKEAEGVRTAILPAWLEVRLLHRRPDITLLIENANVNISGGVDAWLNRVWAASVLETELPEGDLFRCWPRHDADGASTVLRGPRGEGQLQVVSISCDCIAYVVSEEEVPTCLPKETHQGLYVQIYGGGRYGGVGEQRQAIELVLSKITSVSSLA
jgi:hypothetical protein